MILDFLNSGYFFSSTSFLTKTFTLFLLTTSTFSISPFRAISSNLPKLMTVVFVLTMTERLMAIISRIKIP